MKRKAIFLDPNSSDLQGEVDGKKVDLILSPSLYWVKRVTLPLKYVRDVKKLLPSLFEDILPSGNYSYSTYKEGEEFLIFAYEDRKILETISSCGISLADVSGIYFAQSELMDIEGAISINDTQSIYVKDSMVVLVPCCWIEESGDLDLADIILSKHKITIAQYAHIVDNSSLYKLGAVLVALILIIFVEIIITNQKIANIESEKDKIFANYKLKPTMMQNRSMLKKYDKIYKKQTKIRAYISYVLKFKLHNKEKLAEAGVKDTTFSAKFSGATDATLSRMKSLLKSKKLKHKLVLKTKTLHLEIEL